MKYAPAAVSDRDGRGHVFAVEVAAGKIRTSVPILAEDGALCGEVTPDGIVYWDPPFRRPEVEIAPAARRRALARTGRLTASVDQGGTVLAFRVETRSKRGMPAPRRGPRPSADEVEYFTRPARIVSVEGRPVRSGA